MVSTTLATYWQESNHDRPVLGPKREKDGLALTARDCACDWTGLPTKTAQTLAQLPRGLDQFRRILEEFRLLGTIRIQHHKLAGVRTLVTVNANELWHPGDTIAEPDHLCVVSGHRPRAQQSYESFLVQSSVKRSADRNETQCNSVNAREPRSWPQGKCGGEFTRK